MTILQLLFYISVLLLFLYALVMIILSYGWFSLGDFKTSKKKSYVKVSIVIPARNEEKSIVNCLNDLKNQKFPSDLMEVIIVDDASIDLTPDIVNQFMKDNPLMQIRLLSMPEEAGMVAFKKRAITSAIEVSTGDLILTTDADCRFGTKWVSTIVNFYETHNAKLILGPVRFFNEKTWFQRIQSLEFLGLIASGAASVTIDKPIMCNGANMAYEKELFLALEGYSGNDTFASGDDIFLMHKIRKANERIGFLKHADAFVNTLAKPTLKEFLEQRIRWVSKSKGYSDFNTIFVAIVVYLFNLILLVEFIVGFFNPIFFYLFGFSFIVKLVVDFPMTASISSFAQRSSLLLHFVPVQIINVFYIVLVGFIGNFVSFDWKGRKVN